ncbi:MAG TPA: triose-phosphate isomerase [Gammaproteobacteria bacterium]|nr:triose-phosphate isomerase [Gammaproteobacteria bacterium]
MRKKIVAGNWKMNGSRYEAYTLLESIKQGANAFSAIDIILMPPFVYLEKCEEILADSMVAWGAQNLYSEKSGAYTGEISGTMLVDYGCQYVLIGHSERREIFHEDLALIAAKFKTAQEFGIQPILCIGETLKQREQGQTENIIQQQLASVIEAASIDAFRYAVIAYEPVWAIGTGLTATPAEAQKVHAFIRNILAKHDADIAKNARILYGGSVKADNAKGLFAMPDIDGALVGGASLEAKGFLAICSAAM